MATIQAAIQLYDGMSASLLHISNALNTTIGGFPQMQRTVQEGIDSVSLEKTRQQLSSFETEYQRIGHAIQGVRQQQVEWNDSIREGTRFAGVLRGVLSKVEVALSVAKTVQMSDTMMQITARLNLVNDGTQTTAALSEKVFQSAQRVRATYTDTAEAIAKMGINAGNAFRSNDELIAFIEQVNKQFAISGATAEEQKNVMVQLTQAMAGGALRGEELNSVLAGAPGIARNIEKAMGWAEGSIKQYAQQGLVTSEVVKRSMLQMAGETNAAFNSMPMTWAQVWNSAVNRMLMLSRPVLSMINSLANHWQIVEPLALGAAAAVAVYAAATKTAAVWEAISTANKEAGTAALIAHNIVTGLAALATGNLTAAQTAFNAALTACPLFWVALGIGVAVAALAVWIQRVGGLRVAWLLAVNGVLTVLDTFRLHWYTFVYDIRNSWDRFVYAASAGNVRFLNSLGDLKARGLTILQEFVNGAISRINAFIQTVNKLTGASISVIPHVEFGTNAALANEKEKRQRNAHLLQQKNQMENAAASRQSQLSVLRDTIAQGQAERKRAVQQARMEAAGGKAGKSRGDLLSGIAPLADTAATIADHAGAMVDHTATMADVMTAAEEDLKYLRDIAQREAINRFTTAEIKVDMTNTFGDIRESADIDGIVSRLSERLTEEMAITAEGAHM